MNVTVINIKDLLKYLVVLITSIAVIVSATRFFNNKSINLNNTSQKESSKNFLIKCLTSTIPILEYNDSNSKDTYSKNDLLTKIIDSQIGIINNIKIENVANIENAENLDINEQTEETQISINNKQEENSTSEIQYAKENVTTRVVSENNITPSYSVDIDGVQVKNQSDYEVTSELINSPLSLNNKKDIIIFHTHTCESYTPTENFYYEETGNFRTTDKNYSVARVGDELDKYLTSYSFNVIHDTTYHDYPAYTGSYDRSLKTVQEILNEHQGTDIVIDLHRDAVGSSSEYGPSVIIGDEKVAQLMFVIGTDGGGLYHPNWRENFKFAAQIQKKANEMYPGLFRPIILRNSRYNHHLANGACIIEVGATGNTLEECLLSMKYLSKVISEVLK